MNTALKDAWKEEPLMTLKIIFNARSIHLGKGDKMAAYKAFGWLAENHPLTLLTNLRWLVRPVIQTKAPKPEKEKEEVKVQKMKIERQENEFVMVDEEDVETKFDPSKAHDVRLGGSHGYWKDLLNLVVLAANGELRIIEGDPSSLLTHPQGHLSEAKSKRIWDPALAKDLRRQQKIERHERAVAKLNNDNFYRTLHATVARLFAAQLQEDAALLNLGKKSELRNLSLAAKWAPSFGEFHDKHTFILSSIAEILFPKAEEVCPDAASREVYLRYAREAYRKTFASPLRKAISVVERDIAANTFANIHYERVPSLAMGRYTSLFIRKDHDHFSDYMNKVASGEAKISGAVLLPSTLVCKAREMKKALDTKGTNVKVAKAKARAHVAQQVIEGQWKTLVQRIRDTGTLESSIAICDTNRSMTFPHFKDGSCPYPRMTLSYY
jgi:hypothetical protein